MEGFCSLLLLRAQYPQLSFLALRISVVNIFSRAQ